MGEGSRRASRRAADEKMTKSILTMRLSPTAQGVAGLLSGVGAVLFAVGLLSVIEWA